MSVDISCYDNIIGLSKTQCDCFDDPAPYNLSYSNLYLDQLEPLKKLNGLVDCENPDLWQMMFDARAEAIIEFIGHAQALLLNYHTVKRQPFYSGIGRRKWNKAMTVDTGTYYGARFYCADIVSGVLKINNIGALFNATGTVTLKVYNNLNELITTKVITTTANTYVETALNLELPLHSKWVDNLEYFFIYEYDGTIKPLNNDISCGCGNYKFYFDTNKPYFRSQTDQTHGWANWLMAGSYSGDATDFDDLNHTTSNYLYGLTFDVDLFCETAEVLCRDSMDFRANPLAIAIAIAIRYKAGEILITKLLRSTELNREILVNRQQSEDDRNFFLRRYDESLRYVVNNVDTKANDCFDCKDFIKITKSGIFS